MSFGIITPVVLPSPSGDHLFTRVSFYPDHSSTTSPWPYGGAPVVTVIDWGSGWTTNAVPSMPVYHASPVLFATPIATLTNADVFSGGPADRTAGVKIELFHDAALTVRATNLQVLRRGAFSSWKVGGSDAYSWFSGSAPTINTGEIPQMDRSGGGGVGTGGIRATYMGFLASFELGSPGCPGNLCGPADFNADGDVATDQDIESFFACLTGNCCANCFCQGADFNGDGDVGTDQGIEAFFRVFGGGSC